MDRFVAWCGNNHLLLNVTQTKEMVVDFKRARPGRRGGGGGGGDGGCHKKYGENTSDQGLPQDLPTYCTYLLLNAIIKGTNHIYY